MKKWFAIRVTYNREMKVKRELDSIHIENFLPMKYRIIVRGEKKIKELVPAIHNLIFVYITPEDLKSYKATTALPIRYIMNRETREPIVIPEQQMQNFIAVAGNPTEQIVYLDPDVSNFKKGDKVKIIGGVFEGAEGYFMRIKGDRRVVVCINGIAAVATAFIHPSLVKKIDE
jgi:transcription antitermination factor NusG